MELDLEDFAALRLYLGRHIRQGEPVTFKKLLGGVSNRTVRVTWADGHGWVLKQALTKLRVDVDWFSSPERILVEAKALRWLNHLTPPRTTPSFIFEDAENHLMAMEAIPEEHENWKSVLLSGRIIPDHFEQFGFLLSAIHRRSAESGAKVRNTFASMEYFESLRLQPYYLYTAQNVRPAAGFLKELAQETLRHKLSLVHGDFSPKNILIYQGRLILLDHEVVHFGDPAFDVGFALTHFLSKAHHRDKERGLLADAAALFWRVYSNEIAPLGWEAFELRAVHHTLGCLLARVAGKSRLEYLSAQEIRIQQDVVLQLIAHPPASVIDLIHRFVQCIEAHAEN